MLIVPNHCAGGAAGRRFEMPTYEGNLPAYAFLLVNVPALM
jgi:hypothetical protein